MLGLLIFNKYIKKSIPIVEGETYYSITATSIYSKGCPLDINNNDYVLIENMQDLKSTLYKIGNTNYNNYFNNKFFDKKDLLLVSGSVKKINVIGNSLYIEKTSAGTYWGNIDGEIECDYSLIPFDKKITNIKVNHEYYDKDYIY